MRRFLTLILALFVFSCQEKSEDNSEIRSLLPKNEYAMLIVESEGCIYCKQLKKDLQSQTLSQEIDGLDIYSILYDSNAKVRYVLKGQEHVSTEEELAKSLKVNSFPQVFFYDRQGNIILHLPGYQPPKVLACSIRYVKEEKYKQYDYTDYLKSKECI